MGENDIELNESENSWQDPITAESLNETARKFYEEIADADAVDEEESDSEDVSSLDDPSDDDDIEDGDSDASSPSESPSSNLIDLGDFKIAKEEVIALAQFQEFLKSRPDIQVGLRDLVNGKANLVPDNKANYGDVEKDGYSQKRVPENLDLDDPSIKALWDEAQELRSFVNEMRSQVG